MNTLPDGRITPEPPAATVLIRMPTSTAAAVSEPEEAAALSSPSVPYVVYYRVSTKRQGDSGLGLAAQRAYVDYFYAGKPILAAFTDVRSGKDVFNRPRLLEALALCRAQRAVLVVAKIDRLSRNTEQALAIYRQLGGRLESCDIPHLDKFTLTLFMAIADRERELNSIRTKGALIQKLRQVGQWRKGSAAFASGAAAKLGHATLRAQAASNPNSRPARAMISQLVEQGHTWSEIARRLNAAGFLTPKGKAYQAVQVQRLHRQTLDQQIINRPIS